jgi:general secretion pathway protein G
MQINQKKNARSRRVKLMIVMATVIVVAIIVVLAVVAVPGYTAAIRSARESVLNEDLHVLRDGFTATQPTRRSRRSRWETC